ncbi:MAG: winged helix-turn-helix domain-containing protein [Kangiellaceae bacterium]|nr:winged helix-turn-helix domain-containing protein [Kangiellaceae bacterium]
MAKSNKLILGKCEYNPESRAIGSENNPPQIIGHVQAKLLQLLYSSPNVYFSNDDLQREVWDGRVIENTTIRTTVSYLRKALGESEECKYIDSGRNKGYRFVADIEEITPKRQIKKFFPFVVIAALALILIYVVFPLSTPHQVPKIQTTLIGQELEASVSGELMVFSHKEEGSQYWNLYSKEIGKESYFRLTDGSFNDRNSALNEEGLKIAFNRHDGESCQIIVANITGSRRELDNMKKVFDCPVESFSVSIAWKDRNNLYLSYSTSISKAYRVYILDINTGKTKSILSEVVSGRGDYFVTANRDAKKLAYLKNVIGNKTEIWFYDEISRNSSKVALIPQILMSIDWIDENKLVVRTGYGELSSLDIVSGELTILFETDKTISFPFAYNQSMIGYMQGFLKVRDIIRLEPDGGSKNVISSSFRDFSPVYAEKAGSIAFISNRSGKYQIWLLNKENELTQVTQFKDNPRIGNLTISHDGKLIGFVINAHLQIMGTDGSLKFKSKEKNVYKNPVFSTNSQMVYYSSNVNGEWFIESRLMSKLIEKTIVEQGYVIKPCIKSDCFYFIKTNDSILYKSENGNSASTGVILKDITRPDQMLIMDDLVYYLNREGSQSELLQQNLTTKQVKSILPLPSLRFSIQKKPLGVFTSIYREPETLLESVNLQD